jgi:hypothetical protein
MRVDAKDVQIRVVPKAAFSGRDPKHLDLTS